MNLEYVIYETHLTKNKHMLKVNAILCPLLYKLKLFSDLTVNNRYFLICKK